LKKLAFLYLVFGLTLLSKAQAPTVHASNITFTNVYCERMDISWTSGNGSNRMLVVREGGAVNQFPSDGTYYTPSDSFAAAPDLGGGNRVLFNGTGNTASIRGLKKNTTYHFAVFEYNDFSTYEYYTDAGYPTANQLTENITADFDIDDSYQCLYQNSFTFTNNSSNSLNNSMSYEWRMGNGQRFFTEDVTYSYPTGAIYRVQLSARSTGCSDVLEKRDTVLMPFIVDFDLDNAFPGNDSIQCLGANLFSFENLYRKPPPIYGAIDRIRSTWTTSDGQTKNSINAAFSFTQSGVITVKLVQARQVSTGGDFCADSITKTYRVLPIPVVENQVSFSDTALCLNDNEFTFSHSAPDIVQTKWRYGDGDSATGNPVVHSYSAASVYYVDVEVEDMNGCTGVYTDSVEVFTPPNNFFTGLDSPYCIDDPVAQLVPNLDGGYFYGNNVDDAARTFNPNTLGQFEVGYVFTLGNCIDTTKQFTEVLPRPNFNLGSDTFICPNETVEFQVNLSGVNYTWSNQSRADSLIVSSEGTYWVEASNGQCSFRDSVEVRAVFPPVIEFSNYGDTTICGGQTIQLNVTADAGTAIWNDGYVGFSRTVDESGFYEVNVIHPCGNATGSADVNILPFACEIFIPNIFSPNDDNLNETFRPYGFFDFTRMEIFNEYGQLLYTSEVLEDGWDGTYDGTEVMQGMYYYVIYYNIIEEGGNVKKVASGSVKVIR
jgi:gliding motility-associated-like protein